MGDKMHFDGPWQFFGVCMFAIVVLASALEQDMMDDNKPDIIGCLPSSQKLLLRSYFNKHDVLDDSKYEEFLAKHFQYLSSHEGLIKKGSYYMPKLSISNRYLSGEGSHRQLVTSLVFDVDSASYIRDFEFCEAIVVERLPLGIFADAFELQHLVRRGVFLDAAVFGDTNLELPSALSNRSVVEIHMNIEQQILSNSLRWPNLTIVLPLHVRYPPLDTDSYWNIKIGEPDLLLSCTPAKSFPEECSSLLIRFKTNYVSDAMWKIPCGNGEHTYIVSVVTFASALVSALLIVYSSVSLSKKDIKAA